MGFWLCFAVASSAARPWLAGARGRRPRRSWRCLALLTESRGAALAAIASLDRGRRGARARQPAAAGSRCWRARPACRRGAAALRRCVRHRHDDGSVPVDVGAPRRARARRGVARRRGRLGGRERRLARACAERRPDAAGAARPGRRGRAGCRRARGRRGGRRLGRTHRGHASPRSGRRSVLGDGRRGRNRRGAARASSRAPARGTTTGASPGTRSRDKPLTGVGAGNYDRPYFKARQTTEDVRQPHSIEFQALSELGIVRRPRCSAASSAALGSRRLANAPCGARGCGWAQHADGRRRRRRHGVARAHERRLAAPAARRHRDRARDRRGAACATGQRRRSPRRRPARGNLGCGGRAAPRSPAPRSWASRSPWRAASLSRQGLADYFRDRGVARAGHEQAAAGDRRDEPVSAPRRREPRDVLPQGGRGGALQPGRSRAPHARQALHKEPDNFVTWTLLGDLAVRRQRFGEAKRNYIARLRVESERQRPARACSGPLGATATP